MITDMPPRWSPLVIALDLTPFITRDSLGPSPQRKRFKDKLGLLREWLFSREFGIDSILLLSVWDRDRQYLPYFAQVLKTEMEAGMMPNILAGEVVNPAPPIYLQPDVFAINQKSLPLKIYQPDILVADNLQIIREGLPFRVRQSWYQSKMLIIEPILKDGMSGRYMDDRNLISLEELFG